MNPQFLRLADAVLHEGLWLFPYRPSALKNRMRWLFGLVAPAGYERERNALSAQVLLRGSPEVTARARFLLPSREEQGIFEVPPGSFELADIPGSFEIVSEKLEADLWRVSLTLRNLSSWQGEERAAALHHSLASAQVLLSTEQGRFLSCQPPTHPCEQQGWWPVLFDDQSMLISPILLNDYPRVAAESAADSYDATEIEQLLSLSVRALSDSEKAEVRQLAPTRAILDRAESLEAEQFLECHGTFRELGAVDIKQDFGAVATFGPSKQMAQNGETATNCQQLLTPGMRVRLRPQPGRDILDLALDGQLARIQSLEVDFEGRNYVAVTLDEDPGRDLGEQGWPGHRFYLDPEEVERI
jgi:hypothetical protein